MSCMTGAQTRCLRNAPSVLSFAAVGGRFEGEGPLRDYFDELSEDHFFGEKTWEKGESAMQRRALSHALEKAALRERDLDLISQAIFERVYGEPYDADGFSVVMERKEPKQITCRGALMQVRDASGCVSVDQLNRLMDGIDNQVKYNYSAIDKEHLCYADMDDASVRQQLVEAVRTFNDFFCQLCDDLHVVDRFLVDNQSLARFKQLVNKDLEHHLVNGWNFVNKNETDRNASDKIEDTVFFYPIIGSIRDNLIENL